MKTETFEIINLEVWGNEEDGFEVNAAYNTNKFIEMTLSQFESDEWIINAMIEKGFLTEEAVDKVDVEGDGGFLYISDSRTYKPLYELRVV